MKQTNNFQSSFIRLLFISPCAREGTHEIDSFKAVLYIDSKVNRVNNHAKHTFTLVQSILEKDATFLYKHLDIIKHFYASLKVIISVCGDCTTSNYDILSFYAY